MSLSLEYIISYNGLDETCKLIHINREGKEIGKISLIGF